MDYTQHLLFKIVEIHGKTHKSSNQPFFSGPRWSSWNLGLFLCIRCAGIHRNLGVHISKVKSVNLDSWTPLQVAVSK